MKNIHLLNTALISMLLFSACKKETLQTSEEPNTETVTSVSEETIYDPEIYFSYILTTWEVDSSIYWTGNHPSYNDTVFYHNDVVTNPASYKFEYDIPTTDRTVFYDSGTLINGSAFGYHWFPTPTDPTHLSMSIYGGKDVYIQYMSNERLEWIEYDPTGNGYSDSLYMYFHR